MATALKLGPADHGRPMTLEEFYAADAEEGYQYELIDGRLYVSPQPDFPQNWVEEWIGFKLRAYARRRPNVVNYVSSKARVFVPGRRGITNPEPDEAAYRGVPLDRPIEEIDWRDLSPILVVEIVSPGDPEKDLVRNVELYFQVPSIREYWVVDSRADPSRSTLRVYRRHGSRWRIIDVEPGETYRTKLLPGFRLVLDPRK